MPDRGRSALGVLGLSILFEGYGRSLPSIALAPIGHDLDAGPAALSYALAAIAAGALGVVALGWFGDRLGRRPLLLLCVAGYGLLGAAAASAATLAAFVAWQAAARMFQDGALTAAAVVAAEEMAAERRGAAQGRLGLVNQVGAGLAALAFAGIGLVPGGWRGLMTANATPLLLLPFLAARLPEGRRWADRSRRPRRPLHRRYRPRLAAGLLLAFLAMSYDVAGFAFTAYLPMTAHGWSPAATSTMLIVAGGLGLPGWWIGGALADRIGRRPCAAVFLLGLTVAEAAFFLLGPAALWPGFAGMVLCQSAKTAVIRAWSTELFPTAWRASAASWLAAAATLGGIAGLTVAGALAAGLGGIAPAVTVVAGGGVLAAATALLLPETRGRELEAIAPDE